MLRGDFLDASNRNLLFELNDVFVMKSSWILNWASFSTDMFNSSSKEIYHRLSQQTRKFQWVCTKKKKTPVKNIESPSGLRAKLHVHSVFLRDSMHAHSQTQTPNGVTESQQTNSSKIICVFFNFWYHVLEVYLRLQRHFTNLTNQGQQYKRFQGHQSTLFQFIQRMNSNMQSINHFNLRLVSEYEQLWFAIDLYW